ncbi:unnamed protein product [Caenorhabditis angaria]|uniref:NAD(P)H oxidase (H(2)O(2)-forming) n=1 Tax=Caenorhabditis angaria TaxID=860376 RepID=A0A9P1I632_9PELO|nr:unnamed protein product [Caenorhabditis angaria]
MRQILLLAVFWSITYIGLGIHQNEEFQKYDGWYNNLANIKWGSAGSRLHRDAPSNYQDGVYAVNNSLPSARALSNLLFKGESGIPNTRNVTTLLAFFSQVVAYEIMKSNGVSCPLETLRIPVPKYDEVFDKKGEDNTEIPFIRAKYDKSTGNGLNSPREQINEVTSWLDGSFIYGTSEPWVASLRSFKNGRLLEGVPGYPPLNNPHIPLNNPAPPQIHRLMSPDRLFMLGDSRVNENPGLLSFGLILFRWHNFLADRINIDHPDWTDEQTFQAARRFVIASLQKIIAYDFVPALLGGIELDPYTKYMPHVPPGISHAFSAAAFRFPHSIVPPAMLLRKRGKKCEFRTEVGGYPALRLCQNWWNAQDIVREYSVDEIVLGMASQIAERDDNIVVEDLRDYIFGPMHFSRLDVVASSIMRGRDNGLPPYNVLRRVFSLEPKTWQTINVEFYKNHREKIEALKELYSGNIDALDSYVGGMLEGGENGPGELFIAIIKDQFQRIRDGDRFWFENRLNGLFNDQEIENIRKWTLRDIIKATTDIDETMLQKDVFFFKEGDPCPQPFQVNTTNLEPCVPFMRSTYWTDNDTTYVFTLIGLICIPIICFGIGRFLVNRRVSIGHHQACDSLNTLFPSETCSKAEVYGVNALEWIQEEYIRQVRVEIENSTMTLLKPRGRGVLRKLRFEEGQKIEIIHSIPQSSKVHGPFVLISQKRNNHIVFRLPSDYDLSQFLENITVAVRSVNAQLEARSEENYVILEHAVTKEKRQDELDHFFREAYARAFDKNDLSDGTFTINEDDEMYNETITREELASAMGMRENDVFVKRLFAMTAKQNDDSISFQEFFQSLKSFTKGTQHDKFRQIFDMCDTEGTGKVLRKDFADLIRSLNKKAGIAIDQTKEDNLIRSVIFNAGVKQKSEYLTERDFELIFGKFSDDRPVGFPVNRNQPTSDRASLNSFAVVEKSTIDISAPQTYWRNLTAFLETYRQHVFILFVFYAANIILFLERFWHYRYMTEHRDLRRVMGAGIAITRGAAGSLSFCMALVLLTVCRNLITILRETVISQFIPFDSAIGFHKIIALTAAFWATVHTVGHCVNFYHVGTQSQEGLTCLFQEAVFGSNFLPSISYWFFSTITGLTGLALVSVMCIIYVFALPCFIRRAYHAFRLTHLLNIAFYALTILHGLPKLLDSPKFGYYILGPVILFVFDRIIGLMSYYKKLDIVNAEILPSDIIFIEFRRPRSFIYKSGQWVTVSSPAISCSGNESHAFSIASSPQDSTVKLYIKAVGPWTWKLRSEIIRAQTYNSPYPLIHLKGPYGDGNQEWMNFKVAVMVGGGIGVTPYASTLNDLVQLTSQDSFNRVRCEKVYFLWVCPSHKNYEWFVDVLKEVEKQDRKGIIETHIFVTQVFNKFDLRTTMLYICEQHFRGTNSGVSMFTGLHAQNHFGRPDFKSIFRWIANRHEDQEEIGVFSCGPNQLNEKISEGCSEANRNHATNLDLVISENAVNLQYDMLCEFDHLRSKFDEYEVGKVRNLGLNLQNRQNIIKLLDGDEMEVKKSTLTNKTSGIYQFFRWLISDILIEGAFIDFLLTTPIEEPAQLCLAVQSISKKKVSVRLVSRFLSPDLAPHNKRIVEIYIDHDRMIPNMNARATSAHNRYERIRTVGKGAFGSAVLYRRREDSSLVIIKEINMYELDSSQRRLALNEVSLLSRIEHPNIIAYYDSFEEEGVLMIEMEYADGGTLAQLLARTQNILEEENINDIMIQMLSAVAYLHDNSVLHRDLKTANVFLTKDAFVKIGDFGISKIMGTETMAQGAKTVVGTPYYISPEMCSGMTYNEKSDMWALGCILYEMCCLKKAFEGDNLPALVNNIMTCSYTPVKAPYSTEIKMVIRELLQLDPNNRPNAAQALKMLRPSDARNRHTSGSMRSSVSWSTVYELHTSTISLSSVSRLPSRISIKQVSVSETHVMVLTNENEVFGWGDNSHGQLGFEDRHRLDTPRLIDNLKERDIESVHCGSKFSVIRCDRGTILTMGNGKYLGLGRDAIDATKPVLVEHLLRENVREIICGYEHVIAVLESGDCYGWGNNQYGQLGLGPRNDHVFNPTKLTINKKIATGKACKDATILITEDGTLFAMGSNKHNKLNLAQRLGFFAKERKDNGEYVSKPTMLQGFPERVIDFSLGNYHAGVILESGQVMLFGRNENAELGHGHNQKMAVRCVKPVKSLLHHACTKVICGDGFTLVTTTEQELYFWGRKDSKDCCMFEENLEETMTNRLVKRTHSESFDPNVVTLPSLILRLQDERGEKGIRLNGISAAGKIVLVSVDSLEGKRLPSALVERTRSGSMPSSCDVTRTWLREEFDNAEVIPIDESKRRVRFDSSFANNADLSKLTESSLLQEIDTLKLKIAQQDNTFEGHRIQMSDLESKLEELKAKQAFLRSSEPPPEYQQTVKPKVTYNNFFATDKPTTSTACSIL